MPQIGNRQAVIRQNIGGARRAGGAAGLGQARPAQGPMPGPASPAPVPQGAPTPWDLAASQSEANAQRNYGNTLAQIGSNWALTQQEYGLEGPYADAANNPYSKATLLQRSYDNARRGTTNSAGNQLYAGSTVNAQNANTFSYNEGYDALQKGYARAGAEKVSAEQAAQERLQAAGEEANWRRIEAGLQSEPEAAAAPVPAPSGPGSYSKLGKRGKQIKYGIAKGHKAR
jgi:hypothetical protein